MVDQKDKIFFKCLSKIWFILPYKIHVTFRKTYFCRIIYCVVFFVLFFFFLCTLRCQFLWNRIGGVVVSVLASRAVYRGFKPRSGQTKEYKIGICCFSAKHAALRRKSKDWLEIRIMCPSGATCLPADCCFSELAL